MNKKLIIIVAIITIILILFIEEVLMSRFFYYTPFIKIMIEKNHNSKIDYSCTIDEDCDIKNVGCDICYGLKKNCVNKNSVEGICLKTRGKITCNAHTPPPVSCKCKDNKCVGIRY